MSILGPMPMFRPVIWMGDRGVFAGGRNSNGTSNDTIDYITISTTGNATDFGNTLYNSQLAAGSSNGRYNRGCFNSGYNGTIVLDSIEYITINSPGNASDFGDLTTAAYANASTSNTSNNRALFIGGDRGVTVDYITISSTGNATDFGDLIKNFGYLGSTSNTTNERAIISGVDDNSIQYFTINSTGNATDFGDVLVPNFRRQISLSNGTNERGIFQGGYNSGSGNRDMIQYVTINSTGNATDFGDMRSERVYGVGLSNLTNERGISGTASTANSLTNLIIDIDYITINSLGNSSDFGDLTSIRVRASGFSNA